MVVFLIWEFRGALLPMSSRSTWAKTRFFFYPFMKKWNILQRAIYIYYCVYEGNKLYGQLCLVKAFSFIEYSTQEDNALILGSFAYLSQSPIHICRKRVLQNQHRNTRIFSDVSFLWNTFCCCEIRIFLCLAGIMGRVILWFEET